MFSHNISRKYVLYLLYLRRGRLDAKYLLNSEIALPLLHRTYSLNQNLHFNEKTIEIYRYQHLNIEIYRYQHLNMH